MLVIIIIGYSLLLLCVVEMSKLKKKNLFFGNLGFSRIDKIGFYIIKMKDRVCERFCECLKKERELR